MGVQSNLSLQYSDYQSEAGKYLGFGADETGYSATKLADLDTLIDAGYRTALYPPIMPPNQVPHRWSFLKPIGSMTTIAGVGDYAMPDDFEGMNGPLRFDGQTYYGAVQFTSRDHILNMRQVVSAGVPNLAALTPQTNDGKSTSRWKLMLWPTPIGAYTLQYRYNVAPRRLSTAEPWPLGGVDFAECVMEAILAKIEERKEDEIGIHRQAFMERLSVAIRRDQEDMEPDNYGYFSDPSTLSLGPEPRHWNTALTTYQGVAG